jgi:tetratricopeptide (TPR) repeat protein/tRNA A-37 threonylcarbamoyl transferase component Bud32
MNDRENQEELIFEQAVKISSEAERTAYLDQACRGDAELRARLEILLEGHFKGRGFLEGAIALPAEGGGTVRPSPPDEEEVGTVIGRYKLLEKVGEGGFGAVYVAEQREPVKRRVALKIIKLGMDTRQVITRFEAERQALALMDHPNIARVLDAGATETGRPYFVMELVRGLRITDYCDQENLSTRERLDLFMQVCRAVQHAHQKGIIHRDIKPSNILVTVIDGQPVPKVIDFGIAKATQGQLAHQTVCTQFHQFIGTPAYMSPEQAQLSGVDVDTRSDIYSLGVLLYELLTSHTPFDPKALLAAGLDEMRRMIRETDPPRPSTRISTLDESEQTAVAKHRQAEPAALSRMVRGDLDWIVMKCLEKERARRYETANALVRDIEHHLNEEPVTAAAPTALYRAGKFIRRHKAGLVTAIALLLLLATGTVVSTWEAVRATRAESLGEKRLQAEIEARRAAVDEAAKATAISDLLESALQSANPELAKGYFLRRLSAIKRRLGNPMEAERLAREAVAQHRLLHGDNASETGFALRDLAYALDAQQKYAEAASCYAKVRAIFQKQYGSTNSLAVDASSSLIAALTGAGRLVEARSLVEEEFALHRRQADWPQDGREHAFEAFGNVLTDLVEAFLKQGRLDEAESVCGELVELGSQLSGTGQADALNRIAWRLATSPSSEFRNGTNVISLAGKAVTLTSRTNAVYLDTLAAAYAACGQYTNAVKVQQEAIAMMRDEEPKKNYASRLRLYQAKMPYHGPDHLVEQASALLNDGKFAEAEPLARDCLAWREKVLPDDWLTFHIRSVLGGCLLGQKKYVEAEPLLVAGYEGLKCREHLVPYSAIPRLWEALERLVQLNQDLSREPGEKTMDRQGLAAAYRQLLHLAADDSPLPAQDCSRALALTDDIMALARANPETAPQEASLWRDKGELLEAAGRHEEALTAMTKAIELAGGSTNCCVLTSTEALLSRSRLFQRMNRLAEAAEDRRRALDIPPRDARAGTNLIDLSEFFNAKLDEDFCGMSEHNLARLPKGAQIMAQVQFDVRGLVQLRGTVMRPMVRKRYAASVTGIPIHRRFARLHVLHGTCWAEADGKKIGAYVLHYVDGRQSELPIVHGEDVRDWWHVPVHRAVTRAAVAWTGSCVATEVQSDWFLRLFMRTYDNPRPEVEVESVDFLSDQTRCAPFLIALTLE